METDLAPIARVGESEALRVSLDDSRGVSADGKIPASARVRDSEREVELDRADVAPDGSRGI